MSKVNHDQRRKEALQAMYAAKAKQAAADKKAAAKAASEEAKAPQFNLGDDVPAANADVVNDQAAA